MIVVLYKYRGTFLCILDNAEKRKEVDWDSTSDFLPAKEIFRKN